MEEIEVLKLLRKVPKGKVTSYKELARYFNSKAYRHIGKIMSKNKRPDLYPCFKVVKSNGEIGGFSDGINNKIKLLKKEGIRIKNNKIINFDKVLFKFE